MRAIILSLFFPRQRNFFKPCRRGEARPRLLVNRLCKKSNVRRLQSKEKQQKMIKSFVIIIIVVVVFVVVVKLFAFFSIMQCK